MATFNKEKHGYDRSEVDAFVSKLEIKVQDLEKQNKSLLEEIAKIEKSQEEYKQKSQTITVALTAAVEKARQIEESSKNVYKLKIQQMELLYNRFEGLLNEMLKKYPNIQDTENVKSVMYEFKNSIKNTLKDDFKITSFGGAQSSSSDPIRALLSRMNEHFSKQSAPTKKAVIERSSLSKDILTNQTELSRIEDKAPIIKPIYDKKMQEQKSESLVDEFLKENPDDGGVYARKFGANSYPYVNDSGFDLKEAVNPKDDLEEIMKAFDFFNDSDKDEDSGVSK